MRDNPGNSEASVILGAARRRLGDAHDAVAILSPLVARQPRSPALRYELGLALGAAGDHYAAIAMLSEVTKLAPRQPDGWSALGGEKFAVGDRAGSEAAYAQALIVSVGKPDFGRAVAAFRDGRFEEANDALVAALNKEPDDVRALKLLAEVALRQERHDDAEALFERCLKLAPDFADVRGSYASVLLMSNKIAQAVAQLETLLQRDRQRFDYRALMGTALMASDRLEELLAWHEELVRDFPGQPGAWVGYAQTLDALERTEEAVSAYRKAIELCPWFGAAYASLADVGNFRFSPSEIDKIEAQLARPELAREDRVSFHFVLAKILDDQRLFGGAFANYEQANALLRAQIQYDPETTTAHFARTIELATPAFFAERNDWGCREFASHFYRGPSPIGIDTS